MGSAMQQAMARRALRILLLVAGIAVCGCGKQPAPPAAPAQAPAAHTAHRPAPPEPGAVRITAIDLGNRLAPDQRVAVPMTTFAPSDTFHAVVATTTGQAAAGVPVRLGVKWEHLDSNQIVLEESRDVVLAGSGITGFQVTKPGGWPTGRYRVAVLVDGKPRQAREFDVR